MTAKIYSIYDKVALEYGGLFECRNHQTAVRNFEIFVDKSPVRDDYVLTYFGFWDRDTGKISLLEKPETITVAKEPQPEVEITPEGYKQGRLA